MITRSHGLSLASTFFMSCSLLAQIQPAYAENASTDILFTGTVPVTCAFEGLSPAEQLDPQIVVTNRLANCNESVSLGSEPGIVESIDVLTSSEHLIPDTLQQRQPSITTVTPQ